MRKRIHVQARPVEAPDKKHPEEVKKRQQETSHSRCLEQGCGFVATSIKNLPYHLKAVHQMSFTVVEKTLSKTKLNYTV